MALPRTEWLEANLSLPRAPGLPIHRWPLCLYSSFIKDSQQSNSLGTSCILGLSLSVPAASTHLAAHTESLEGVQPQPATAATVTEAVHELSVQVSLNLGEPHQDHVFFLGREVNLQHSVASPTNMEIRIAKAVWPGGTKCRTESGPCLSATPTSGGPHSSPATRAGSATVEKRLILGTKTKARGGKLPQVLTPIQGCFSKLSPHGHVNKGK